MPPSDFGVLEKSLSNHIANYTSFKRK